jgi:hypothetical protein
MNNDSRANIGSQLWCAHSGIAFLILMALGIFIVAGWLPVHQPGWTAEEITAIFQRDQISIRIGMTLLALAAPLAWSFAAAISAQLKRIEGAFHPLSTVQMASATGAVVPIIIPAYLWLAMAYRPELTPPGVMQIINDFCWFTFVGMFSPAVLQAAVIGACILSDKRADPVFPRWVGFANLWAAVLFLPGALLPFFKHGPFAWNGIIGFWLVAVAFFAWYILMWWSSVRAIKRQGA